MLSLNSTAVSFVLPNRLPSTAYWHLPSPSGHKLIISTHVRSLETVTKTVLPFLKHGTASLPSAMGQEAGRTGSAAGFAEKTELILCLSEAGKFAS